jgi:hypothetical protein
MGGGQIDCLPLFACLPVSTQAHSALLHNRLGFVQCSLDRGHFRRSPMVAVARGSTCLSNARPLRLEIAVESEVFVSFGLQGLLPRTMQNPGCSSALQGESPSFLQIIPVDGASGTLLDLRKAPTSRPPEWWPLRLLQPSFRVDTPSSCCLRIQ